MFCNASSTSQYKKCQWEPLLARYFINVNQNWSSSKTICVLYSGISIRVKFLFSLCWLSSKTDFNPFHLLKRRATFSFRIFWYFIHRTFFIFNNIPDYERKYQQIQRYKSHTEKRVTKFTTILTDLYLSFSVTFLIWFLCPLSKFIHKKRGSKIIIYELPYLRQCQCLILWYKGEGKLNTAIITESVIHTHTDDEIT